MFILTSLALMLIGLIYYIFQTIDIKMQHSVKESQDKKSVETAQINESAWLANTDLVVKENGRLMFYPKRNVFSNYSEIPFKAGHGYPCWYTDNGLETNYRYVIFKPEALERLQNKTSSDRLHFINGNRIILVDMIHDIYKEVGSDTFYIPKGTKGYCKCTREGRIIDWNQVTED